MENNLECGKVAPGVFMSLFQKNNYFRVMMGFVLLAGCQAVAAQDEIPPPPAESDSIVVQAQPVPAQVPQIPYVYKVPLRLPDGWKVGDLRDEKADLKQISDGVQKIISGNIPDVHSLVVLRHGEILLEEYFNGHKADDINPLYSCTKSVFSAIYGIAQDQGLLNLDQKIYDLYPEYRSKNGWSPEKDSITVGMLLSMTSGFDCNDAGPWESSCGVAMAPTPDWVAFCFGLPLIHPPGRFWMYNGTSLSLLSNLISRKSGMSFSNYARKYLLDPLGIPGDSWVLGPGEVAKVDTGLFWKSRDMAKLGLLYLNKGKWEGKRIVSAAWVKDATTAHAPPGAAFGEDYGYLWHIKNMIWKGRQVSVFYANGYQGQAIFVSPDADLICVITAGSNDGQIYGEEENLFESSILGCFK
jgi:CubicO group peptidase (beta-lactamase class C family)